MPGTLLSTFAYTILFDFLTTAMVGTRIIPVLQMRLSSFPNKTPLAMKSYLLGELKALGEGQSQ